MFEIRVNEVDIRIERSGGFQRFGKVFLHRLMVGTIQEEQVTGRSVSSCLFQPGIPPGFCLSRVSWDLLRVIVPTGEIYRFYRASIRTLPQKFTVSREMSIRVRIFRIQRHAPSERGSLKTGLMQDLRHLADVPEGIGEITDAADTAEGFSHRHSLQQVADVRLTGGQVLILQHIPGTDMQPAFQDKLLQLFGLLRTQQQVILHRNHLSIEVIGIIRVACEQLQHIVQLVNQPGPVNFKREVPFPIPMGVRYDMYGCLHWRLSKLRWCIIRCMR